MARARSLSDIKSKLLRPALTSHFEVEIGLPSGFGNFGGDGQDKLNLLCSETVLPGSRLNTQEIKDTFTGVGEKIAYRKMYDQAIDLTFYVDAKNYLPIKFFERWISYIANEDYDEMQKTTYNYRMKYRNEYEATGLTVRKFERDFQSSGAMLEYKFISSYPLSISSMPVSYESSSLLKCTVNMCYIRYVVRPSAGDPKFSKVTPSESAQQNQNPFNQFDNPFLNYGNTNGPDSSFVLTDASGERPGANDGPLLTTRQVLGLDPR